MNYLNHFLNNRLKIKKESKYSLIIGETPSKGARSPKLWNRVYKAQKSRIRMYPADVSKNNINNLLRFLKNEKNYLGGSVTAPYKVLIMKYLDNIDKNSKKIGSVNTIVKNGNKLSGFNTDFFGSLEVIKKIKKQKKILVLGAGGAARPVILSLTKKFKNSEFIFYNRNSNKIKKLAKELEIKNNFKIIQNLKHILNIKDFSLVVNATSIGFDSWVKKDKELFNLKFFTPFSNLTKIKKIKSKNQSKFINKNKELLMTDRMNIKKFFLNRPNIEFFDIIYNPKKTKLLKIAEFYGNKIYNGLEMNLTQAVKGFMIVNKSNSYDFIKKKMINNG